jgi:hypothetical protein
MVLGMVAPFGLNNKVSSLVERAGPVSTIVYIHLEGPSMKTFMAVFTGNPAAFEKYQKQFPDPEKRRANEKAGMDAWMKWATPS